MTANADVECVARVELTMWYIEAIGIVATIIILASFLTSDIRKIRVWNAVGSVIMIVYGLLIHSISTPLLNICMIILQVYKLKKETRRK